MITVADLTQMINQAIDAGEITTCSEVRFVNNTRDDCSLHAQHTNIKPGWTPDGRPMDRRFAQGVLMLAQESVLQPADKQVLRQLDWSF